MRHPDTRARGDTVYRRRMTSPDTAIRAVFSTLARATADGRTPVVLRPGRPAQARDLERWLARVHGSDRTVITSAGVRGLIEVRLPARLDWPAVANEEMMTTLPAVAPTPHLSGMAHLPSRRGIR